MKARNHRLKCPEPLSDREKKRLDCTEHDFFELAGNQAASRLLPGLGTVNAYADVAEIGFPTNEHRLDTGDQSILEAVANAYDDYVPLGYLADIYVDGYADFRGTEEDNMALAQLRAESVANVLSTEFDRPEIHTYGVGEINTGQGLASCRKAEVSINFHPYESAWGVNALDLGDLGSMLEQAVPKLMATGTYVSVAMAEALQILMNPSADDRWVNETYVRDYSNRNSWPRIREEPWQSADHLRVHVESALSRSGGDVDTFCYHMETLGEAIRLGLEACADTNSFGGDSTVSSSKRMKDWAQDRQQDPSSVLYPFG